MIKKSYHISGFDCAHCAAKAEAHLAKNEHIVSSRIDFAGNKLYLSFKEQELTVDEIKNIIMEVETDDIEISEKSSFRKSKIFTKDLLFLSLRIIFGLIVIVLSFTALSKTNDVNYFWANFSLYLIAIIILTYDVVWKVIKHIVHKENPIDEYLLITIAVLGAFAIGIVEPIQKMKDMSSFSFEVHDFMESVMVVGLFQIGRIIEGIATNKSKEAVIEAIDLRVEKANLLVDNEVKAVSPSTLKVNDVVICSTGDLIPIDGTIIEGEGLLDTSSLTGEFVPVEANKNKEVYSGFLVKSGSIKIRADKEYKDSAVSKVVELISNSGERKSKADKFITKFARWYTPSIFIIALLFVIIGGAITADWSTYVFTGLKMLVVACPCAIVISVPLAYFSAVGLASKHGIVVKGTNYLDELNKMKKLVTDKTGTLTHGSFSIRKVVTNGVNEEEFLNDLYAVECLSSHPIARAICHGQQLKKVAAEVKQFQELTGLGTICNYRGSSLVAGRYKLIDKYNVDIPEVIDAGTVIYLLKDKTYLGYVVLSDEIKEDAEPMVGLLHKEGIEIVLLTGDKEENARDICKKINIDRWYSELLPEQKTQYLEKEMSNEKKYSVAYIGDGINDAASIKLSDIGIAMGGIGSDIAVENADIVIMNDDPAKVWDIYRIAKMARNTSIFNIVFALFVKVSVELVAIIPTLINSSFSLPMWAAVLADTGLTVLMVINSLLVLYRKVKRKL